MNRSELIVHLISGLSHYVLESDPMRVVVSLHQEEDGVHVAVLDDTLREDDVLQAMRADLNRSKRPELAGYYGSMSGYDMLGHARLDLVGWQVKHADVNRTDSGTRIDLWLGGDRFDPTQFNIPEVPDQPPS